MAPRWAGGYRSKSPMCSGYKRLEIVIKGENRAGTAVPRLVVLTLFSSFSTRYAPAWPHDLSSESDSLTLFFLPQFEPFFFLFSLVSFEFNQLVFFTHTYIHEHANAIVMLN